MPQTKTTQIKEITRHIPENVSCTLWARAAGRCQFAGCNRLLYKSTLTQDQVNLAEKAHIYAFSKTWTRGWGSLSKKQINGIGNLLLVCHDCHKIIDKDALKFPAELLQTWKDEHETRVQLVTGISPDKRTHVLLYKAKIGDKATLLTELDTKLALFPKRYPASERATTLHMNWAAEDHTPNYWTQEQLNLESEFKSKVVPLFQDSTIQHFSVFGFAPMPLLINLGTLLSDKIVADVYQLRKEPQTWQWAEEAAPVQFRITKPTDTTLPPVIVIALSSVIDASRIHKVLGSKVAIWQITIDKPHNDFLKTQDQLCTFREHMRLLLGEVEATHGKTTRISIFPAMPVACAIELGRIRSSKATNPWTVYDHNWKLEGFAKALDL